MNWEESSGKNPGSKLVELDNVGHLPHIEVFDQFAGALLPFIKNKHNSHFTKWLYF